MGKMTDVTIRGIDDDVYASFSAEARKRSVPIGELVTVVMRAFLDESSKDAHSRISFLSSLEVSQSDLEEVNGEISFSNLGRLQFNSDVTWETFDSRVTSIEEVGRLSYPKGFPRLPLLAKCHTVGKLLPI